MRDFRSNAFAGSHAAPVLAMIVWLGTWACAPTVQIEPPKEPIVIDLNIKIEHEIRVRVDNELDQLFEDDDELF